MNNTIKSIGALLIMAIIVILLMFSSGYLVDYMNKYFKCGCIGNKFLYFIILLSGLYIVKKNNNCFKK
jgi:hypothetical protein